MKAIEDYLSIKPFVFSIVLDQQLRFFFFFWMNVPKHQRNELNPLGLKAIDNTNDEYTNDMSRPA